jgi:hypothetical protein
MSAWNTHSPHVLVENGDGRYNCPDDVKNVHHHDDSLHFQDQAGADGNGKEQEHCNLLEASTGLCEQSQKGVTML